MSAYVRFEDDVEVVDLNGQLADGSLGSVRAKFADSIRHRLIHQLIAEVMDGTLYLGDWQKGEIQITGIVRITTNRYWTEIDYHVLFPPKPGKTEPAKGTYRYIIWNAGESAGAAALLITTGGDIIVLKSFRHAARRWCLEIPRGVRKPGESDEDCAKREASEECGAQLTEDSRVLNLGPLEPDTGALRSQVPIVIITNVVADASKVRRDVSESVMGPVVMTRSEFLAAIRNRDIKDALLCGAFTMAMAHALV